MKLLCSILTQSNYQLKKFACYQLLFIGTVNTKTFKVKNVNKRKFYQQNRATSKNWAKTLKINPEGTCGSIDQKNTVLEPWCIGHHASTKKIRRSDKFKKRHIQSDIFIDIFIKNCAESSKKMCWVILTPTSQRLDVISTVISTSPSTLNYCKNICLYRLIAKAVVDFLRFIFRQKKSWPSRAI